MNCIAAICREIEVQSYYVFLQKLWRKPVSAPTMLYQELAAVRGCASVVADKASAGGLPFLSEQKQAFTHHFCRQTCSRQHLGSSQPHFTDFRELVRYIVHLRLQNGDQQKP